jgi:glycosyltransferase involved in cell wall biosynthesis
MPELIQTAKARRWDRRILMNTDNVGGVWTYSLCLIEALAAHDTHVILAINGSPLKPAQRQALQRLSNCTAYIGGFPLEWMDNPWRRVKACGSWLQQLAERYHPDLVHLNDYSHAIRDYDAPVLVVAHSDVYSWFHAVLLKAPDHADAEPYHQHIRAGLRAADLVTAPTETVLNSLERHYGSFSRAEAIANAIPDHVGLPEPPAREPNRTEILAAARLWDQAKNMALLDQAAEGTDLEIFAAGDTGTARGEPSPFPNLHLLGHLSSRELRERRAHTAIHVAPSLYEPFGLSSLEAARFGCALVLGDLPSQREIWGSDATLLDPRDPIAWRKLLVYLASDPEACLAMGRRAWERSRRFTPQLQARQYLKLYDDLCSPTRKRRNSTGRRVTLSRSQSSPETRLVS